MNRIPLVKTEDDVERKRSQGYGQGEGADYIPWLLKHFLYSRGNAREIPSVKALPRSHHLLSRLEYAVFIFFERFWWVVDVREQYPLFNRDLIERLAIQHGIRPPVYPGTKVPYVLTTDLLLTIAGATGPSLLAISVKPSSQLKKRRTRELLELERLYWKTHDVPWWPVTERDLPHHTPRNIHWLRDSAVLPPHLKDPTLNEAFLVVLSELPWEGRELRALLSATANVLNTPDEVPVALFKHHSWWGKTIEVNLEARLSLPSTLPTLTVYPQHLQKKKIA